MQKRVLLAILLVYLAMFGMDYVIHQVILSDAYAATAWIWRPMEEMKLGLIQIVSLIAISAFALIYVLWIKEHSIKSGLKYGLLFGLAGGVSMGYGTFSVMPIPYFMAFTWCWGTVVKWTVAGLIAGLVIKRPAAAA